MSLLYTRGYDQSVGEHPVSGSQSIATGDEVAIRNGYLIKAVDTAGASFVGVSLEDVDNSSGDNGDVSCRFVKSPAEVSLLLTGSAPSYGTNLYLDASGAVTSATGSNSVLVGTSQDSDEDRSNFIWVSIKKV